MREVPKELLVKWWQECFPTLQKEGWELYDCHSGQYYCSVQIRRPYKEGDFHFNEDGYEYNSLFPDKEKTRDYLLQRL